MDDEIIVVKEFIFHAAHRLPNYDGPCSNLHGHTYRLQVGISGSVNKDTGMLLDFGELKQMVEECLAGLDHCHLNECDLPEFPRHMPTAENMVLWIKWRLAECLPNIRITLVRLWETPTSYAEWRNNAVQS